MRFYISPDSLEAVDSWVRQTLDNRADKSWTPTIKVNPFVHGLLKTIDGYATKPADIPQDEVHIFRGNEIAASYTGLHIIAEES